MYRINTIRGAGFDWLLSFQYDYEHIIWNSYLASHKAMSLRYIHIQIIWRAQIIVVVCPTTILMELSSQWVWERKYFLPSIITVSPRQEATRLIGERPNLYSENIIQLISHPQWEAAACKWTQIGKCCVSLSSHPRLSSGKDFHHISRGLWTHLTSHLQC